MTILEVRLLTDEFAEDGLTGTARAKQRYYVEADSYLPSDLALQASDGTTSIPTRTGAYSATRPRCLVTYGGRSVRRISATQVNVDVEFSDLTDGSTVTALLDMPARITSTDEQTMEEYVEDKSDPPVPVRNTAGEPFDRGPDRITNTVVFQIVKYVNATTRAAIRAAVETVNASPKTIDGETFDTGQGLLTACAFVDVATEDGVWEATIYIKARKDGWDDKALNVGLSSLEGGRTRRTTITELDDNNVPRAIAKPWPLNPNGSKKTNSDDAIDILTFKPYASSAWSGVPLS